MAWRAYCCCSWCGSCCCCCCCCGCCCLLLVLLVPVVVLLAWQCMAWHGLAWRGMAICRACYHALKAKWVKYAAYFRANQVERRCMAGSFFARTPRRGLQGFGPGRHCRVAVHVVCIFWVLLPRMCFSHHIWFRLNRSTQAIWLDLASVA